MALVASSACSCIYYAHARRFVSLKAPLVTGPRQPSPSTVPVTRFASNGPVSAASASPGLGPEPGPEPEPISEDLIALLQAVASGEVGAPEAAEHLNSVATWGCPPPASESDDSDGEAAPVGQFLPQANFPEVVWGEGKTAEQIASSLERIAQRQGMAAATRVPYQTANEVQNLLPGCEYNATGQSITLKISSVQRNKIPGTVALITAGTANKHVVEECRVMLQATGCYCFKLPDAGVMGMHRVVENLEAVRAVDVVICITGMDGGVASVVAGMVECPVISLPTSTGYGVALGGIAALMSALTSSAPGVTVVNIDSGFGAAMAAWRILASKRKANKT